MPTVVRERLIAALDRFQVGAQTDDTAAVVMRMVACPKAAGSAPTGERELLLGNGVVTHSTIKPSLFEDVSNGPKAVGNLELMAGAGTSQEEEEDRPFVEESLA